MMCIEASVKWTLLMMVVLVTLLGCAGGGGDGDGVWGVGNIVMSMVVMTGKET